MDGNRKDVGACRQQPHGNAVDRHQRLRRRDGLCRQGECGVCDVARWQVLAVDLDAVQVHDRAVVEQVADVRLQYRVGAADARARQCRQVERLSEVETR